MKCFTGEPANLYDQTNPDWAPSVNMGSSKSSNCLSFGDSSRYERLQARLKRRKIDEVEDNKVQDNGVEDNEVEVYEATRSVSCQTSPQTRTVGCQSQLKLNFDYCLSKEIKIVQTF